MKISRRSFFKKVSVFLSAFFVPGFLLSRTPSKVLDLGSRGYVNEDWVAYTGDGPIPSGVSPSISLQDLKQAARTLEANKAKKVSMPDGKDVYFLVSIDRNDGPGWYKP